MMKKYPISEIFGPTIQGEGIHAGRRTQFIRFAECDTHCDWCDTKYAWEADKHMTEDEIIDAVTPADASIMTITGGNPLLQDISNLVQRLFLSFHEVHVETQGTIWKDWLYDTSFVSVSPKKHHLSLPILDKITGIMRSRCQVKVVVFSREDLGFLHDMYARYKHLPFIIQVGWPYTARTMSWLADYVAGHGNFNENVRVLPQIHRVFWGDKGGI
jgi:7-carboxy-7-deazaguanine synthase